MTEATSTAVTRTFHETTQRTLRSAVTDAITDAVLQELAAVGYPKLSMDGVARRAGSSKPTLYRRWASKEDMVVSALQTIIVPAGPSTPATGDLRTDLRHTIRDSLAWMKHPVVRRVLPDIIAEGMRNETFAALLNSQLTDPRRKTGRETLGAGAGLSEFDLEFIFDLIAGQIFWRLCSRRQEIDEDYVETITDLVHGFILSRA